MARTRHPATMIVPASKSGGKQAANKVKKSDGGMKKKAKPGTFSIYIHRVMKQLDKDIGISVNAMSIINSFANDLFTELSDEMIRLSANKKTVSANDVETATKLILPVDLAKPAVMEGKKAVIKYNKN